MQNFILILGLVFTLGMIYGAIVNIAFTKLMIKRGKVPSYLSKLGVFENECNGKNKSNPQPRH